jgi:hypothetical protein
MGKPLPTVRRDSTLSLSVRADPPRERSAQLMLMSSEAIAKEKTELTSSYNHAIALYPPWRDLSAYRAKLLYLVIVLAFVIEVVWNMLIKITGRSTKRLYYVGHFTVATIWLMMTVWVEMVYLRV